MNPDQLLAMLERVRQTGSGRYVASCPAHKDRNPSLSVRVADDGRILLHCFAGCDIEDITGAIGLTISDLFPDRPLTQTALRNSPLKLRPAEALLLLGHETFVVVLLVEEFIAMLRRGEIPSELGVNRLVTSVGRIQTVRSVTDAITPPEFKAIRQGLAA